MKRIFCGLLCAAALLLTACGQKTPLRLTFSP